MADTILVVEDAPLPLIELPAILVSGEVAGRDMPNVADARFTKPVNVARLIDTIEELIDAKRVPD